MKRFSIGVTLVVLAFSAVSLPACMNSDVQLGGAGEGTGVWEGYVTNYEFHSGSDKVVIRITGKTGDAVTGTLELGEGPDLPPPTDPNTTYPPWLESGFGNMRLIESFDYPLADSTLTSNRLKGRVYRSDPWSAWCELQTSYEQPNMPGHYACVPNTEMQLVDGACMDSGIAFNCTQYWLCSPDYACRCDADGCETAHSEAILFDFEIDGDEARGSVTEMGANEVRLTRVQSP